jgi:alpha,alpha-trehalase
MKDDPGAKTMCGPGSEGSARRSAPGAPSPPSALERLDQIAAEAEGRRLAVFLDYDGTLTPIAARPELATMSEEMRAAVRDLAGLCSVAIVSGRDRADVEEMVGVNSLSYAGSHGFDIAGPDGRRLQHEQADRSVAALREAADELRRNLNGIPGAIVEEKKYAVAVHYRLAHRRDVQAVRNAVEAVAARHPALRKTGGKKVLELRPRVDWDKGKAVLWLLRALDLDASDVLPIYLGDDETDEDAFAALQGRGIGILVAEAARPTHAGYLLGGPDEARLFLQRLTRILEGRRA